MDLLRFFGFVLVAIVVFVGLDYYQQDKNTDMTLSLSGYVDTVNHRFNARQQEAAAEQLEQDRKNRWREGGKPYLPASSDTWVRRAIVDHDYTVDARLGAEQAKASDAARPLAIEVAVQEAKLRAQKLDRIGWAYDHGDTSIWIQASLVNRANTNTLVGNLAQSIASMKFSTTDFAPLGVIGGVAYFQAIQDEYYDVPQLARHDWAMIKKQVAETGNTVSFNTYVGTLGFDQEIRLLVRSDAPADEVYDFLGQVDYDGLNALLAVPVPGVGNDTKIDPSREADLAIEMANLRSEFVKLRGELASMRIENIDSLSLVANTMAGQYGLPNDAFDLTANNISSPQDLMEVGYRKGMVNLMVDETELAAEEGTGLFGRLLAKISGGATDKGGAAPEENGLLNGLKSKFQSTDNEDVQSAEVTVRKGLGEGGSCALLGSSKRCSVGGN